MWKIEEELDLAYFIRLHLKTQDFFKYLLSQEKRKAARDLKHHLNSDQSPASDDSCNIEPDPFDDEEVVATLSNVIKSINVIQTIFSFTTNNVITETEIIYVDRDAEVANRVKSGVLTAFT